MENKCSFVATMHQNRRELPREALVKQDLYNTEIFMEPEKGTSLTAYQCQKNKRILLLSSLYKDVKIPEANHPKHKPDIKLLYNKNKIAVDIIDQMTRLYSVKGGPIMSSIM